MVWFCQSRGTVVIWPGNNTTVTEGGSQRSPAAPPGTCHLTAENLQNVDMWRGGIKNHLCPSYPAI